MARHFLGVGHERATQFADLAALVADCLRQLDLTAADIALVASIDAKAEAGLVDQLAAALGIAARFFTPATLEAETPRLRNPSEAVFARMGCHGVAEAAALAAAGPAAELILPKTSGKGVTCAIARRL